jgi:hypothetical protein
MPQIAADPPSPVIACFPGLESNNFNDLVLICFCFARATYASASPTVCRLRLSTRRTIHKVTSASIDHCLAPSFHLTII